jgi:3-hydroxyisobutyrate dehydrogenase-like beta-hydroxyacid dehydrogenase
MKKIGIIGAGVMASGMARNFLKHDIEVYIWNRTRSRVELLSQSGATVCSTPKDVVSKADITIECVSDTPASRSVWLGSEGILAGADENKVLIIASTVSTA